jgi:hypothetical protein
VVTESRLRSAVKKAFKRLDWTDNPITMLMLMPSCQNTSVSLCKTQAAARKAQAS